MAEAKKQKTDALNARALVDRLDRWLRGNGDAFSIVTVPTPLKEQARAQVRLRDQLGRMRRRRDTGPPPLVGQWLSARKRLVETG